MRVNDSYRKLVLGSTSKLIAHIFCISLLESETALRQHEAEQLKKKKKGVMKLQRNGLSVPIKEAVMLTEVEKQITHNVGHPKPAIG